MNQARTPDSILLTHAHALDRGIAPQDQVVERAPAESCVWTRLADLRQPDPNRDRCLVDLGQLNRYGREDRTGERLQVAFRLRGFGHASKEALFSFALNGSGNPPY